MKTIIEMAREAGGADIAMNKWTSWVGTQSTEFLERFAALVRADERKALIRYFNEHWRSDWSDGQIIEALEARGNT